MFVAILSLIGLLFCLVVAVGMLASVTLQAIAIVCGVLFLLILILGFVPSTAFSWRRE